MQIEEGIKAGKTLSRNGAKAEMDYLQAQSLSVFESKVPKKFKEQDCFRYCLILDNYE